ncbi:MAG: lipoprotein [Sulfuritalea sp.]|nr:lipoprotein [Sulfuritalea sp.]
MKPHIRPIARCCLIASAVLMLAGCGSKGPLTLPAATPAAPAHKAADHISPAAAKAP